MAGFGRTGKWFASEHWDVVPDILTMAKGINSGYVPLGAMAIREPIADWIRSRYFAGGLTYSGHPLASAVGVASIEAFREEGIVEHAAELGPVFASLLGELANRHPSIGEVRGLGASGASSSSAAERRASRSSRSMRPAKRRRPSRGWRRPRWSVASI
jgi:taurine--2-oxoglutarate transaminase